MLRTITLSICFFVAVMASAQEPASPVQVTSAPIEMQAVAEAAVGITATGDHDTPPSHPQCSDRKDGALDCTADLVLAGIRQHMEAPTMDLKTYGEYPVTVTFVVNRFGDMKDVRVDHSAEADLAKRIVVAVYDMPKFTPAVKAGAATGSTIQVVYRYADLFDQE
ncbi:MAG: hypothetical protein R2815_00335 [Flavobacteriales bacterium]